VKYSQHQIKKQLTDKAKQLGFQDLKIAQYTLMNDEAKHYNEWIESGYNATMSWMERNIDKRHDIRLILPEAKSIITLAHSYFTDNIHPTEISSETGKISRYAWGSDYHNILKDKIILLENELKSLVPDIQIKSYIDTGPVLEKQWAVHSGLGWQGKNGLILNKKIGSYFFIAVMITNLELPSDLPVKDYCGTCTKCITACPTDAIISDKVIDSNKCLSYWTIEAKPDIEIPAEIASNAKNWIFGCDICQEVCPWNKIKPILTNDGEFQSRLENGTLSFIEIENLTQEEFSKKFKKSPVKRLKLAGLKRNARDILGKW
jgi:epoxyqueuosine reductase